MTRWLIGFAALAISAALFGASASDDDFGGLPDGEGREEVFVICSGCHSIKLVVQQGLTRDSWQESLDWMVEEQGMPEMDAETHARVLNYLAENFGIDHRPPR